MTDNILSFLEHRLKKSPVVYVLEIGHHADFIRFELQGVQEDARSYHAVADDLRIVIEEIYAKFPDENEKAP